MGFTGLARSGKTKAAMLTCIDTGREVFSFAGHLKKTLSALVDVDIAGLSPEEKESRWRDGVTYRQLMQQYGQAMRDIYPRIWIEGLESRVGNRVNDIVIDDVRHPNEAEWIRANGGVVIRLHRMGSGSKSSPDHISESGQHRIEVDHTIDNNGSFGALQVGVMHYLHSRGTP